MTKGPAVINELGYDDLEEVTDEHIVVDEPATALNTTHRTSDGKNHSDVVTNTAGIVTNVTAIGLNTTHKGSDGSDHSKVGANETAIGLNTTHRGSDGSDHSKVGANETAIGLNTTHRGSDGSDHSKVGTNETAIGLNTTHSGSDGSDHSKIGDNETAITGKHSFVHRDLPDSPDFVTTRNETGTITSQQDNHCIDSAAGFQTANIAVGDWIRNFTDNTWAQVTAINSETDLTLDANIFPADDSDAYYIYQLRSGAWYDLDLSSIIDSGSVLVLLYIEIDTDNTNQYIFFRKNGVTSTLEINGLRLIVANLPAYGSVLVACDANRVIEFKLQNQDKPCNVVVGGWWK